MNKLAIITVVYNNYKVLEDFIKSLEKQSNKSFHLFVADLSDRKQELDLKDIHSTVIVSNNLGYAHGVNLGLKKAVENNFENFCILNNDIYFQKDFVENVLTSLNKNTNTLIGGKIYYAAGYEYHKNRYQKKDLGHVIWYAGGSIDWDHALTLHLGVDEIDNNKYNKTARVDFITGCLMIFDKKILDRIGLWDESYFLYYEDADWCMRAKKSGVNLIYNPSIIIWHKNSESTGKPGSPTHVKYQNKNRLKFGLKYAPIKTKLHLIKNYLLNS